MPVSTAARTTGSPSTVNGPAQLITAAQSPNACRSASRSPTAAVRTAGDPSAAASGRSLSGSRPQSTNGSSRRRSSAATSRPV